jgi:hypothetical protein
MLSLNTPLIIDLKIELRRLIVADQSLSFGPLQEAD